MALDITKEKFESILNDNKENIGLLKDLAREVNGYNGYLDSLDVQEFDEEFFNNYFSNAYEAARATNFGTVNWSDEWIRFDGYGNLESLSEWEYDKEVEDMADEIIENAVDLFEQGNLDPEWIFDSNDIEVEEDEEADERVS